MKTLRQFIFAFILLVPVGAYSGTHTFTNVEIPGVSFTIAMSNSVIKVDSTHALNCRVASTNYTVGIDSTLFWGIGLVLSNSSGKTFVLAPALSSLTSNTSAQPSYRAEKDKPCEWQIPLAIPGSIPPGNYTLVASKFVWIRQAPGKTPGNNPHGWLVSNPLALRLTP